MEYKQPGHQPIKVEGAAPAPVSHTPPPAKNKKKLSAKVNKPKQLILWLLVALLFLAAVGAAAYYVNKYNESQKQVKKLSNPTEVAKQESNLLIAKIGALTLLPKGETPTVATVTDVTKLKDQAFFASAQNGDKVLIYTQAKKAVLYRPSTNKIINIAPVNLGNGQSTTTGTNSTTNTTTTPKNP
ncbi:hypothetical protein KW803_03845 [Candidatus Saccharibacteria bacterium]|nr:hypothetical protein [Candidatus Saccharibacteria bacterium]